MRELRELDEYQIRVLDKITLDLVMANAKEIDRVLNELHMGFSINDVVPPVYSHRADSQAERQERNFQKRYAETKPSWREDRPADLGRQIVDGINAYREKNPNA